MSLWRVFPGSFSLVCCGRPVTCKCKTIFDSSITYSRLVSCRKLHHGRPAPPKLIFNPKQVCSSTSFSVLPLIYRDKCTFSHRTHNCGSITASNIGERVRLCGWLHKHRNSGLFLLLRDWSGVIQVITNEEVLNSLGKLTHEMVLEVEGTVQARLDGQENKDMATGEIEVIADRLRTLNTCASKLPIDVNKKYIQSKESLRMEYRYLDIRGNMMQHNLRLRSQIIMKMREFLCNQHGFVDVETPTLFRKTPGGAKEFVVPSRQPGKFYSLPQSPQQFKQLLMVGGLDRYFQIAKCYRDEGSKPDRQPEFTQVDIELSFTTQKYVQEMIEQLLKYCWPEDKGQLTLPFPQMTYDKAMTQYGVDKPDTRFEMKLTDVSDIMRGCGIQNLESDLCQENGSVICVKIPNGDNLLSNKEVSKLKRTPYEDLQVKMAYLKQTKDGVWKYSTSLTRLTDDTKQKLVERLAVEPADVVYLASGQEYDPHKALGRLRCDAVDFIESKGTILRNPDVFNFLWVTDFPLFLPKEDGDGLESAHHPFTAPHPDDEHLLYTAPERIRSQHYDLVLNGNEIGGGSIRIHNSDVQKYVLEKILQEDSSQLNHLLEALGYGCPPHGGIALGLDRLLAIICQAESIRDVIAFPKSVDGKDFMSQAPANVSAEDLAEYHINVIQS